MISKKSIYLIVIFSWAFLGFSCYRVEPLVLAANFICDKNEEPLEKKSLELIPQRSAKDKNSCKKLADQGLQVAISKKGGSDSYGYVKNTISCQAIMFIPDAIPEDHTQYKERHIENFKKISANLNILIDENSIALIKFETRDEMDNWCLANFQK